MALFKKKQKQRVAETPKEDVYLTLPDCIGLPTRVPASKVKEWQKGQEERLRKIEAGEVWDPRKGPSPEQQELYAELLEEIRAEKAKKTAENKK